MRCRTLLLIVAASAAGLAVPGSGVAQSPDRLLPDLSLPTFSLVGSPRLGTCNRVSVAVHNGGNRAAQDVVLDVKIWNDGYFEDFEENRKLAVGALGPGETKRLMLENVRLNVSHNRVDGYLDKANRILESNEGNNWASPAQQISMLEDSYCNNFTMDDIVVSEGSTATFTIKRGGGPGPREPQTVGWRIGDTTSSPAATGGSACSSRGVGPDYVLKSGTVTFGRYDTSKTVSTEVCKDRALEGDEEFHLSLTGLEPFGSKFLRRWARATIRR